jgi:hypothetical protein
MKHNTKRILLSAAGLMLSASNTLAAGSTDIVGNLGFFSTLAAGIRQTPGTKNI